MGNVPPSPRRNTVVVAGAIILVLALVGLAGGVAYLLARGVGRPPLRVVLRAKGRATGEQQQALLDALTRRAARLGARSQVRVDQRGRIIVSVWGAHDRQVAKSLSAPGRLVFVHIPRAYTPEIQRDEQTGRETTWFTDHTGKEAPTRRVLAEAPVIVTGADLKTNARVIPDPSTREPEVAIEFTPEGADKFYRFTRTHRGQYLAIVLDGTVISAPVIRAAIRDRAIIEGGFASGSEAQDLANLLNAGSLPLEVEVESVHGSAPPP